MMSLDKVIKKIPDFFRSQNIPKPNHPRLALVGMSHGLERTERGGSRWAPGAAHVIGVDLIQVQANHVVFVAAGLDIPIEMMVEKHVDLAFLRV